MSARVLVGVPLGLACGSLAANAAVRWPVGLTLGRPARSRCDGCGTPIVGSALIPLLGWLLCRGRCRARGCPIPPVHPLTEAGAGLAVGMALVATDLPTGVLLAIGGLVLVTATALDIGHRWIPDRLTLPAGAVLLPAATVVAVTGATHAGPGRPLVVGLGAPAVLALVRRLSSGTARGAWIGGGDVKLLVPILAVASLVPGGVTSVWAGTLGAGAAVIAVGGRRTGRIGPRTLPLAPLLLAGWFTMLAARIPGAA